MKFYLAILKLDWQVFITDVRIAIANFKHNRAQYRLHRMDLKAIHESTNYRR